jgi:small subunit ribosomal protein S19|uniref:Small ribosomal subunit protein uS19m n=1 Tax=Tetraselmis subcordiformis TaxID=3161 RepID=RT19_TETSU|nr:RecName: Full=Small ribosomal subunit protein uS19m; AltName: Full=Ribosomal protein S19, mitochondrial [Tetraselmis subcordiformis]CAA87752.1 ribosomal protein S19 [Tetraselmis subcordiformis]
MSRAIWKGPFIDPFFFRKNGSSNSNNKIYSRRSVVSPKFIGREVEIYNGHKWITIKIKEDMIGHKFGEFAFTRKATIHKKKTK